MECEVVQHPKMETMRLVVTSGVSEELSALEVCQAISGLLKKMQVPDPDNPNLWSVRVGHRTVWGILDKHAGPDGEDLFTVLFPCEY